MRQSPLSFNCPPVQPAMPRTRYQGSKRKLADWIGDQVEHLRFHTVLDAFGGTGAVSHMFKRRGKAVTYNDILRFNYIVGKALIENARCTLSAHDIDWVVSEHARLDYPDFIERTFAGIYFTTHENRWLDVACRNVQHLDDPYKQALAYFAIGQAAIAKRPYNLFHRRNLYMRTANVKRGFGNKTTWDRPFEDHFRRFAAEGNQAVLDTDQSCLALNLDALDAQPGYDLVYIDPPYVNGHGVGVDYRAFYHFLEGLVDYDRWPERIDWSSKHRCLTPQPGPWTRATRIGDAFRSLFQRFASSILVVSYRSDGIPSPSLLAGWLREIKPNVRVHRYPGRKKYALSTNSRAREVLIIAAGQT